jgi:ribonuclease BN (tRNA processing enzyme)
MKRAYKMAMKRSKLVYTGDTQQKENLLQFLIILLLQHIK